jgi:two-component system sensor histidine kinase RegB
MTQLDDETRASARITLRSLIAARWALVALVLVAVVVVWLAGQRLPSGLLPSSEHPLVFLIVLLAWAALNLPSMLALRRDRASEMRAGGHLLIDALALTALLGLSGGSANPFTILYFLPITLATQVSPRWTWALAITCLLGFAGLFVLVPLDPPAPDPAPAHDPAPTHEHAEHDHAAHAEHDHAAHAEHDHTAQASAPTADASASAGPGGHAEHFAGHQRGMWVAFGIAGVLMTVFVHRTALALARQRSELAKLRQTALEDRHLAAIGTLAAGAAHELGTPLGTIKLLVDELPHMPAPEREGALATVREQLGRCKLIVSRMASPELRVSALGAGESWPLGELREELDELGLDVPLRVELPEPLASATTRAPLEVVAQLLRELVANAAEACRRTGDPTRGIVVSARRLGDRVEIVVADAGIGMDEATLASAFDPFFTTRPEGSGMGMGLYLARAHLRQLGGGITIESKLGAGTRVRIDVPLVAGS